MTKEIRLSQNRTILTSIFMKSGLTNTGRLSHLMLGQESGNKFVEEGFDTHHCIKFGGVESILSYPATMSHAGVPYEVRLEKGITDGLLRYSVGLEGVEDIIKDLHRVLSS